MNVLASLIIVQPDVQTTITQWPDATSQGLEGISSDKVPTLVWSRWSRRQNIVLIVGIGNFVIPGTAMDGASKLAKKMHDTSGSSSSLIPHKLGVHQNSLDVTKLTRLYHPDII